MSIPKPSNSLIRFWYSPGLSHLSILGLHGKEKRRCFQRNSAVVFDCSCPKVKLDYRGLTIVDPAGVVRGTIPFVITVPFISQNATEPFVCCSTTSVSLSEL